MRWFTRKPKRTVKDGWIEIRERTGIEMRVYSYRAGQFRSLLTQQYTEPEFDLDGYTEEEIELVKSFMDIRPKGYKTIFISEAVPKRVQPGIVLVDAIVQTINSLPVKPDYFYLVRNAVHDGSNHLIAEVELELVWE